jgi:hypothetical protein
MRSNAKYAGIILLALSLILFTSCAKKKVDKPSPLGPAGFAVSLKVSASPNVLFAGTQSRETTTVSAVLTKYDGTPLAGKTIFFELRDALNARADGVGYFEGVGAAASRVTDGNGRITIDYHGPMAGEIPNGFEDTNFYITANVAWEGAEGISEWTPIYFVQDFQDLIFNVTVDPNVLWCSNTRPESKITVFFAVPDGTPIAGRKVFFKIKKGKGQFPGGVTSTYSNTGSDGYAIMTYQGPTGGEMTAAEEFVTIDVQPETWWAEFGDYPPGTPDPTKYYIHVEFDIRLKKGN